MTSTMTQTKERTAEQVRAEIAELVKEAYQLEHAKKPFVAGQSAVPVSGRVYTDADVNMLVDSSLDFWLTTGRYNQVFEKQLGTFLGAKFVLTCNSGSSANLLAATALTSHLLKDRALKPGDEVITCATGFPTTVNPLLMNGLIPVFVDVHLPTYNIDPAQIEAAVSPRTKAIMVAHTLGNPFDLDVVMDVAKRHNLFVVEDTCDALGATWRGRKVGTIGDIGTVSFYPAHHITMGEGGAVFTQRSALKRALESLRDWGRDCYCEPGKDNTCGRRYEWQLGDLPTGYDHKYTYSHLGYNLKITDMQAAVGVAQMGHLPGFIEARRNNFKKLHAGLQDLQEFFLLPEATPNSDPSWFGFPLTVQDGVPFTRDEFLIHLNEKKIGTRLLFGGNLLRQPYMKGRPHRTHGTLENSDRVMNHTFWIGVYPGLGDAEIGYILDVFHDFCRRA
ncbi:MAG TPA: lipopolysaccharide biosynthesis protein RfbH [Rickettsiales bacterium]|nr:lipopolysaccharide biosynthesis protein RfbH [Rickettsiales bacterium]